MHEAGVLSDCERWRCNGSGAGGRALLVRRSDAFPLRVAGGGAKVDAEVASAARSRETTPARAHRDPAVLAQHRVGLREARAQWYTRTHTSLGVVSSRSPQRTRRSRAREARKDRQRRYHDRDANERFDCHGEGRASERTCGAPEMMRMRSPGGHMWRPVYDVQGAYNSAASARQPCASPTRAKTTRRNRRSTLVKADLKSNSRSAGVETSAAAPDPVWCGRADAGGCERARGTRGRSTTGGTTSGLSAAQS